MLPAASAVRGTWGKACAGRRWKGGRGRLRLAGGIGRGHVNGHVAHFEHLFDGRDAGNGIFGELADAVGERAEQLAADIDGAAAHALDHAGIFGFGAVELGQDHVLAGAARAAQYAQNLNLHGLGGGALEDGPRRAGHAGAYLAEREKSGILRRAGDFAGGFRSWGRRMGRELQRFAPAAEAEDTAPCPPGWRAPTSSTWFPSGVFPRLLEYSPQHGAAGQAARTSGFRDSPARRRGCNANRVCLSDWRGCHVNTAPERL